MLYVGTETLRIILQMADLRVTSESTLIVWWVLVYCKICSYIPSILLAAYENATLTMGAGNRVPSHTSPYWPISQEDCDKTFHSHFQTMRQGIIWSILMSHKIVKPNLSSTNLQIHLQVYPLKFKVERDVLGRVAISPGKYLGFRIMTWPGSWNWHPCGQQQVLPTVPHLSAVPASPTMNWETSAHPPCWWTCRRQSLSDKLALMWKIASCTCISLAHAQKSLNSASA